MQNLKCRSVSVRKLCLLFCPERSAGVWLNYKVFCVCVHIWPGSEIRKLFLSSCYWISHRNHLGLKFFLKNCLLQAKQKNNWTRKRRVLLLQSYFSCCGTWNVHMEGITRKERSLSWQKPVDILPTDCHSFFHSVTELGISLKSSVSYMFTHAVLFFFWEHVIALLAVWIAKIQYIHTFSFKYTMETSWREEAERGTCKILKYIFTCHLLGAQNRTVCL